MDMSLPSFTSTVIASSPARVISGPVGFCTRALPRSLFAHRRILFIILIRVRFYRMTANLSSYGSPKKRLTSVLNARLSRELWITLSIFEVPNLCRIVPGAAINGSKWPTRRLNPLMASFPSTMNIMQSPDVNLTRLD